MGRDMKRGNFKAVDSYIGAPNLARLVSVSFWAFQSLMIGSARRRLWEEKLRNDE